MPFSCPEIGVEMRASTTFLRAVRFFAFAAALSLSSNISQALAADEPPAAKGMAGLPRTEGYVPFYWDAPRSRVLIEVPLFNKDVLY